MSASPATLNVLIGGGSVTSTITITRVNYTGAVALNTPVLPTGVTAAFNPASLSGTTVSSTLTITAGANATPSNGPLDIRATGPDSLFEGIQILLTVLQPQVRIMLDGTGTGTVSSNPSGVNCGTVCNVAFPFGTNVTLTATPTAGSSFGGWLGGGCTGTSTTCSLQVTTAANIFATFNSGTPSFGFRVNPTAAVPQGGNATTTATVTRSNGFAGTVAIVSSGAPSGLTIAANPAGVTDNTATINIAAASSVAAGNYPVTITASASGLPSQTTFLNVQVTSAPGGSTNVAFSFARCDPSEVPIWFAAQNGTGAWTRVTPGPNNTFTFAAGATGGIAMVQGSGSSFGTSVFYGNREDITALALGRTCNGLTASRGTQQLVGTLTGVVTPLATVSIGGASTESPVVQGQGNFTLSEVPAGRRDLIATATNVNASGVRGVARMILRRDVTYVGSIPQLNFIGPEFFVPATRQVTTNNLAGDQSFASARLITGNGASAPFVERPGGQMGVLYPGVPDSLLQPGDLHAIEVIAASATGTSARVAIVTRRSAVDDTVDFGPALSQPAVTNIGTSPYLRMRAQLGSQTAYNGLATAGFSQNATYVGVTATAGYTGNAPVTWSLDIPDLTSAGYNPAWGLKSGSPADWEVAALGGSVLPPFGATPVDGGRALGAVVSSPSSAANRLRRFRRW